MFLDSDDYLTLDTCETAYNKIKEKEKTKNFTSVTVGKALGFFLICFCYNISSIWLVYPIR